MTRLNVPDSPKALRETLCVAQVLIGNTWINQHRAEADIARLQRLIDECDRHRPLGPDGKHGDRHTPTCGCDKPTLRQRITAWWRAKQAQRDERMGVEQ